MDPMLAGVHPILIEKMNRVLAAMAILGYRMKVCQGFRTAEQQHALFLQTPKVTSCDGYVKLSNHQSGRAVDCCAEGPDPFPKTFPWSLYGACVRAVGLKWGGDFKPPAPLDLDHAELGTEIA